MRDLIKIRVISGFCIILLWFLVHFLFHYFGLYFTEEIYSNIFDISTFVFLFIGGGFLMAYEVWKKKKIFKSVNLALIISVYLFFKFLLSLPLENMCGEVVEDYTYVNQLDDRRLYSSYIDCGAWDSTFPDPIWTERIELNKFVYRKIEYLEDELDLSVWKIESTKHFEWKNK